MAVEQCDYIILYLVVKKLKSDIVIIERSKGENMCFYSYFKGLQNNCQRQDKY